MALALSLTAQPFHPHDMEEMSGGPRSFGAVATFVSFL
jgi:hypothetical protein